ncbi:hypothetical protein [Rhodococcus sp. SJ-3]|uniref:hypothetical protein n=1 Tax=Rhodococcus sp. SJ-3 TaxID=3454628 RepID=UPI003F7A95D5
MRRSAAVCLVALGLVIAGCGGGAASNGEAEASTATTTVTVDASTGTASTSQTATLPSATAAPSTEPHSGVAVPAAGEVVSEPPASEQANDPDVASGEPVAGQADTSEGPRRSLDPNPYDCVGDICPNPYSDAPPPDPNADPQNPQISWCGTDKNVHNRGATVYDDGTWTPWSQQCADEFDAVNNPPNPPGTMGGGGAVAGPCHPDEEGLITHTPDMRKQQCSGGHWVYVR